MNRSDQQQQEQDVVNRKAIYDLKKQNIPQGVINLIEAQQTIPDALLTKEVRVARDAYRALGTAQRFLERAVAA